MSDRNEKLEAAHFAPAPRIAGKTLRKMGPVSFVMLKRVGNRLTCGGMTTKKVGKRDEIDFDDPDNLTALLEFIYVHSAPIEEVIAAVAKNRAEFEMAVLVYTSDISLADLSKDSAEITSTIERAGKAMVEEKRATEQGDSDPNALGRRG